MFARGKFLSKKENLSKKNPNKLLVSISLFKVVHDIFIPEKSLTSVVGCDPPHAVRLFHVTDGIHGPREVGPNAGWGHNCLEGFLENTVLQHLSSIRGLAVCQEQPQPLGHVVRRGVEGTRRSTGGHRAARVVFTV